MNRTPLSIPEVAIIAGTRAALGAGAALLLADRLNDDQRRAVGWTLLGIGVITTFPIVAQLLGAQRGGEEDTRQATGGLIRRPEYAS